MTDTPTTNPLAVENALLRAALFLCTSSLKGYHDSPHSKPESYRQTVTVHEGLRERAGDAIARADRLLREPEHGRGR